MAKTTNKYDALSYREWSRKFSKGHHQISRVDLDDYIECAKDNDLSVTVPDYDQPRDTAMVNVLVFEQLTAATEDLIYG